MAPLRVFKRVENRLRVGFNYKLNYSYLYFRFPQVLDREIPLMEKNASGFPFLV